MDVATSLSRNIFDIENISERISIISKIFVAENVKIF